MNKLKHIIARLAWLVLPVLMSAACQLVFDPVDDGAGVRDDIAMITFEMDIPTLPNSTRTPAGDYDPGMAEWENFIDYEDNLRFYFFDSSSPSVHSPRYLGYLNPDSTFVEGYATTGSDYKRYVMRGLLSKRLTDNITGQANTDFRIVAMANCNKYPEPDNFGVLRYEGTAIHDLSEFVECMQFTLDTPILKLDRDHLIPMFGVKLCSGADFVKGEVNDIGTLHMLRALAKVDICVSQAEFADLKSVVLQNYNLSGLCAPRNVTRQSDYVHNSYRDDYLNHISLINNVNESGHPAFAVTPTSTIQYGPLVTRNVYTVYIPEHRNRINNEGTYVPADDRSYFDLTFDDGVDDNVYQLEFKYYSSDSATAAGAAVGDFFNVSRNNYYKYTVRRFYTLDAEVEVVPYFQVELDPQFGFDEYLPPKQN